MERVNQEMRRNCPTMSSLKVVQAQMRDCRICLDAGHDIVPGGIFSGEASARLMLIGQAPGVTEVLVVDAPRPKELVG